MLKEREVRIFEQSWTTSCLVTKEIIKKYMWDENQRLRRIKVTEREIRSEIQLCSISNASE